MGWAQAWPGSHTYLATQGPPRAGPAQGLSDWSHTSGRPHAPHQGQCGDAHPYSPRTALSAPQPSSRRPEAHAGVGGLLAPLLPVPRPSLAVSPIPHAARPRPGPGAWPRRQQVSGRWSWGLRESVSGSRPGGAPNGRGACCPAAQPGFVPGLNVPTVPAPPPERSAP